MMMPSPSLYTHKNYFVYLQRLMEKMRRYIGVFLLTVFLAAYGTSSLHKHPEQHEDAVCLECVQHHHSNHIGTYDGGLSDCVLCHFLGLPFVIALASAILPGASLIRSLFTDLRRPFVSAHLRLAPSRAPPVLYFA